MGEDLSTGAKLGISMVILCSIVAIVISLLTVIRNLTVQASSQVQTALNMMSESFYSTYDQTKVTGNDVLTCVSFTAGNDCAIIVKTTRSTNNNQTANGVNYGSILTGYTNIAATGEPTLYTRDSTKAINSATTIDSAEDIFFLTTKGYFVGEFYKELNSTTLTVSSNTRPLKDDEDVAYVSLGARFNAYLIKDRTGATIGVFFIQI